MKRAIIALTLIAAVGGVSGTAFAGDKTDKDNSKSDNHNVCIVFANDQKYNDTTYYCVSTPNLP